MLYWGSLRMEKWVVLLHSLIKTPKKETQAIWLVPIYMCFSLFQCFVSLCTCRRTCVWVHVHLYAHVWRDQKSPWGSFLKHSSPCLIKNGALTVLVLNNKTMWAVAPRRVKFYLVFGSGITAVHLTFSEVFKCGLWGSNSGSNDFTESTLGSWAISLPLSTFFEKSIFMSSRNMYKWPLNSR